MDVICMSCLFVLLRCPIGTVRLSVDVVVHFVPTWKANSLLYHTLLIYLLIFISLLLLFEIVFYSRISVMEAVIDLGCRLFHQNIVVVKPSHVTCIVHFSPVLIDSLNGQSLFWIKFVSIIHPSCLFLLIDYSHSVCVRLRVWPLTNYFRFN